MSSIFMAATTLMLLIASLGPGLSEAQRGRPSRPRPMTAPPAPSHYYDDYLVQRRSVDKVMDGVSSTQLMLSTITTPQVIVTLLLMFA